MYRILSFLVLGVVLVAVSTWYQRAMVRQKGRGGGVTVDAAAWNAWTTVTPVAAAPANRPRFVRVRLPITVDPGPDGAYADLRVVDDRGAETPYALDPERAQRRRRAPSA